KEYIAAGDAYQIVLSRRLDCRLTGDPFTVYRALRTINPSPYLFFLRLGKVTIVGSSPEVLVRVEGGAVALRPIAGTRPRGATEAKDHQIEEELKADPKERAEHVMLVDLGRNDVGRVSELGSVKVTEFMAVERYSHVMHLVSHVTGRLRRGTDALGVLQACFPAGTLTGAPKIRAVDVERIVAMTPERIVISPGPGTPDQAGVSLEVIRRLGPTTPVLGVCLGHQAIGQAYGGTVARAKTQMHGKISMIRHDGRGVF